MQIIWHHCCRHHLGHTIAVPHISLYWFKIFLRQITIFPVIANIDPLVWMKLYMSNIETVCIFQFWFSNIQKLRWENIGLDFFKAQKRLNWKKTKVTHEKKRTFVQLFSWNLLKMVLTLIELQVLSGRVFPFFDLQKETIISHDERGHP